MLENIDPMATLLALDYNDDLSSDVILYLLRYGETEDRDKFVEIMMQAKPQLKEQIVTIEQQWRMEGRQEGHQEGKREEKQEVAQRMMQEQLDFHTIMKVTGLSESELEQLHS